MKTTAYKTVDKAQDRVMRFLGWFAGDGFAERPTTYRLPFMAKARVCVPKVYYQLSLARQESILEHEKVHVEQFAPWYGPWVVVILQFFLPLPILFSGRWFIERRAYLGEIREGETSVEEAISTLWTHYGWPWPRSWMRRWFIKKLTDVS